MVDAADAFDPRSAHAAGVDLPRLLWVRPRGFLGGLQAADRVLDAGGFALVVLYLAGVPMSRSPIKSFPSELRTTMTPALAAQQPPPRVAAVAVATHAAPKAFLPCRLFGHDASKLATRRAGALARGVAPREAVIADVATRMEPTFDHARIEPREGLIAQPFESRGGQPFERRSVDPRFEPRFLEPRFGRARIEPRLESSRIEPREGRAVEPCFERRLRLEPHLERSGTGNRRAPTGTIGAPAWARLQQRAEKSGAAVLLIAEFSLAGSFAVVTLEARRGRADWTGLLDGIEGTVRIVRSKLGAPGALVEVARAAE